MTVKNTLAYYNMTTITAVKRFLVQAPGEFCGKGIAADNATEVSLKQLPYFNEKKMYLRTPQIC